MILSGDPAQIDLKFSNDSAIHDMAKIVTSDYVTKHKLKDNHRNPALKEIMQLLNEA